MQYEEAPFKFISGMGMSIGHFICGTIRQKCKGKNINRYLQMEPFPFTGKEDNAKHRENMINKAGIFIFIFGDLDESPEDIQNSGMWKEYVQAKYNKNNILIPLPCGENSISYKIFEAEKEDATSFSTRYHELLQTFDYQIADCNFFDILVEKVLLVTREKMDAIIDIITDELSSK